MELIPAPSQVGNLVQNNRLMQPPQNGVVLQGIRTPQQQLQLPPQASQGLRATPPRPSNLSPTGANFPQPGTQQVSLQTVTQLVQQNNPGMSAEDARKLALETIARHQKETMRNAGNNLMQQHLQQSLAKSSPTQANQQIRRSPSQQPQGQQRMS
jgi:hypothetical protein